MTTLIATGKVEHGRLRIDLPTTLPAGEFAVEIRFDQSPARPRGTDIQAILALAGTLKSNIDPMEFQRKIRDEWPD